QKRLRQARLSDPTLTHLRLTTAITRLSESAHLSLSKAFRRDLPCSFDLAAGAYNATGLRWLRNAAIAFLNVSGNFFPLAGSMPSAPMAGTNSG
uniref:hypothetical protein n=1 Tax=Roseomonas rosulenta TaxID=2748667 RepID=UPI0018E05868